ncbi:MAG: 2-hydroxymuconate tautomerase [Candidatus Binatia bacterium]
MPLVHVYMFEGRTAEQRRKIVAGITQAMVDGAGTDAKEVHVLLHDMPISAWSNGGVLYSEDPSYIEKRKRQHAK